MYRRTDCHGLFISCRKRPHRKTATPKALPGRHVMSDVARDKSAVLRPAIASLQRAKYASHGPASNYSWRARIAHAVLPRSLSTGLSPAPMAWKAVQAVVEAAHLLGSTASRRVVDETPRSGHQLETTIRDGCTKGSFATHIQGLPLVYGGSRVFGIDNRESISFVAKKGWPPACYPGGVEAMGRHLLPALETSMGFWRVTVGIWHDIDMATHAKPNPSCASTPPTHSTTTARTAQGILLPTGHLLQKRILKGRPNSEARHYYSPVPDKRASCMVRRR
ncbi:hypothetical protein QBC47DRAFT_187899 [Echria macrotheca]|uniref:Uncharacterized protein n=1 Tax=Echria macrotheca TaxID=438768 RepID=A0AAJ0BGU3_9PEZI|nr:hypothetical protein QBC47DRAFT_187899 [Echria macrotheca]